MRDSTHTILIETGVGSKVSPKRRSWHDLGPSTLLDQLAAVDCSPEAIDTVILTHLHFDHTGGSTRFDSTGAPVPTFPNARYLIQRIEWEDAVNPGPQTHAAYLPEDFLPISESGQLELVDGDQDVIPGLSLWRTGGHCRGHQAVILESGGRTLCYTGDLLPIAAQIKPLYMTAFDLYPVETFAAKTRLLESAIPGDWLLLLGHDEDHPLIRVVASDTGFAYEEPRV